MNKNAEAQGQTLARLEAAARHYDEPERIHAHAKSGTPGKTKAAGHWFVPYVIALAIIGAAVLTLQLAPALFGSSLAEKLHRYLLGGLSVTLALAAGKAVEIYAIGRLHSPVSRFNLKRILRLAVAAIVIFIGISVLFINWYAAVVSLGLISLILGFALQTPISSFIGWIYILIRAPYRVGDRIEIGDARGDVIDVSYLDTTLWEIGGRHLSTDHPSGRLIKLPNTTVFSSPVINYSWPLFPYVWNEIKFDIAYESDLEYVANTMQAVAMAEIGESMAQNVKRYRELLSSTPVQDIEVNEKPAVLFRTNPNTWIEAIVRYLVQPKDSGHVKSVLTQKLLVALKAEPDRVLFPKSNMR